MVIFSRAHVSSIPDCADMTGRWWGLLAHVYLYTHHWVVVAQDSAFFGPSFHPASVMLYFSPLPPLSPLPGTKQSGERLDDIVLPPWAKGDALEFIRIHREVRDKFQLNVYPFGCKLHVLFPQSILFHHITVTILKASSPLWHKHISAHAYMLYTHMYTYTQPHYILSLSTHPSTHTHTRTCTHARTHTHTYTHTHTHTHTLSHHHLIGSGVWLCICSPSWMDRPHLWMQADWTRSSRGTQCLPPSLLRGSSRYSCL